MMGGLKVKDIVEVTNGRLIVGEPDTIFTRISTDSRHISKGDLFIALRGSAIGGYDGHAFVEDAISKGAKGALVMKEGLKWPSSCHLQLIAVKDTLVALGDIAAYTRKRYELPVVGITGSTGKTTVKELCASILSAQGVCLKTERNYNNLIGVPLTLIKLNSIHQFAVIEMGTNSQGEIDRLSSIVRPTVSVMTNINPAHLNGLLNIPGIIREKQAIFANTLAGGAAIINPHLEHMDQVEIPGWLDIITFSTSGKADVTVREVINQGLDGTELSIDLAGKIIRTKVSLPGHHNILNALAACACAVALNIPPEAIAYGIREARFPGMRLEITVSDSITIVDDTYNANPASMKAALDILGNAPHTNKVAILGDMLELGKDARYWHEQLGKWVALSKINKVFITGTFAHVVSGAAIKEGMDASAVCLVEDVADLKAMISDMIGKETIVLVKASRALQLDKVATYLKAVA